MRGKAFRQVVRGRVIRPATPRSTKNGKNFLTFQLAVDNLDSSGENKTGYLGCAYFPPAGRDLESDIVACALGWITTDESNPVTLTQDGFYYKSVEVTVEGQLSLSSFKVKDENGNEKDSGAYYVNLQFCNLDIHDKNIVYAVRNCLGLNNTTQTAPTTQVQQPTTAPTPATPQVAAQVVQAPPAPQVATATVTPQVAATPQTPPQVAPAQPTPVVSPATAATPTPQVTVPTAVPTTSKEGTAQTGTVQSTPPQEGALVETASGDVYQYTNGQYVFFGKAEAKENTPTPVQAPGTAPAATSTAGPSNLGEVLNTPASSNPSADLAAQRTTGGQQVG